MAKKSVPPDQAILDGLRKAIAALPGTKPLCGSGGIFAAAGSALADAAVKEEFFTTKLVTPTSGKSKKLVTHAVITEKGIRRVLDADGPKVALEALLPAVQSLGKQPEPPTPDAFRAELAKATETCVDEIKKSFAKLEGNVLKALAPPSNNGAEAGPVLHALKQALERVQAPTFQAPTTEPQPPTPPLSPKPDLDGAIMAFVNNWAREKTVGCQFNVLWDHLQKQYSDLTIGAFQDALRNLHESGRLRLSGWPRTHDEMPNPQLALFISSKVMYHAQPAHSNG